MGNNISNIAIHASIIIAATNSIAHAEKIEIDSEYDVSEDLLANLDEAFEKIAVKKELANSFNEIVTGLTLKDQSLVDKYFSEFAEQGVDVAQAADAQVGSGCSLFGSQLSSCYSNCHANCHGACHGSRGWR